MARLMSTGRRLTAEHPPKWPFNCRKCVKDGRNRVVSADGIWLGHLPRRAVTAFEDYCESCLPEAGLLDKASLIPSECVKRFVRLCLTHPEKAISVTRGGRHSWLSLSCSRAQLRPRCWYSPPPPWRNECAASSPFCKSSVGVSSTSSRGSSRR